MTPWSSLERARLSSCEPDLEGWIVHPAETISALAYLVVAAILWLKFRSKDRMLSARFLPPLVGFIGIGSLIFHAGFRDTFQRIDLGTISLLTSYLLATALVRRKYIPPSRLQSLTIAFAVLGITAPQVHIGLGFALVTTQALIVLWLWQQTLTETEKATANRAKWLLIFGALLLGLDHASIGCFGGGLEHLIQPHAVWHILSAVSLYYVYCSERHSERQWNHSP